MEHKRTSFAFLMEMLWVCGFFVLAACIFVLAFVKADNMSRGAKDLNRAVLAAENAIEDTFAGYEADPIKERRTGAENITYLDRNWTPVEVPDGVPEQNKLPDGVSFCLHISSELEDGLLQVTADVFDSKVKVIYSLNAVHYIPDPHYAPTPLTKGGTR